MPHKIDLNLLEILCTLVETGNATDAAERLGVGLSTISYSLNKLRDHYSDPIMIRTKTGMQPTLLAIDLYKNFSPGFNLIESASLNMRNSGQNQKRFYRIRTNSVLEGWIAFNIAQDNYLLSKNAIYEFNNFSSNSDSRMEALRRKKVDIDIGTALSIENSIAQYQVILKGMTIICGKDHPRLKDFISIDILRKEKILTWVNGNELVDIDARLVYFDDINNLFRPVRLSSFDSMLTIVSKSDYVCLVPTPLVPFFESMYSVTALRTDFGENINFTIFINLLSSMRNDPVLLTIINYLSLLSKKIDTINL